MDQKEIEKEIDIWMIRQNLSLSYEERAAQHQDTLNTIEALKAFRDKHCAKSSIAAQDSDSESR